MQIVAIVVFGLAAVVGLYMAVRHFTGKEIALSSALVHGLFAASALVVLAVACFKAGFSGLPTVALGLFVVAALGGFALLTMQLRRKRLSSPLLVVHALVAVAAFLLLVYAVV